MYSNDNTKNVNNANNNKHNNHNSNDTVNGIIDSVNLSILHRAMVGLNNNSNNHISISITLIPVMLTKTTAMITIILLKSLTYL